MEPRFRSSASQGKLFAAPPPEPPCSTPFGRAPRGVEPELLLEPSLNVAVEHYYSATTRCTILVYLSR
jgi:hypothetical protein